MSWVAIIALCASVSCSQQQHPETNALPALSVSSNHRFLIDTNGKPFFWLGDTGWLLFSKLTREEADMYLADRAGKGFNVIQVMVLHSLDDVNMYGDSALMGKRISHPRITKGSGWGDSAQYDYWDHVDYIIDQAAKKNIYLALVPVWGSNVRSGRVRRADAVEYAGWLARRYRSRTNIIWLNGGDVKGSDSLDIWNGIGKTLRQIDSTKVISFHPFGRTTSSLWFHEQDWLDVNMCQSGHRRYDQDDSDWGFGEDNWRYIRHDYELHPVKPVLDGEPSYEGIPQGLHDPAEPNWTAPDIRRSAYWSVFAGGCGFTYGANSVMQFYKPTDAKPAYGAREYWTEGKNLPGSGQMQFLKRLVLSRSYVDRVPDQSLIAGGDGGRYDHLVATRGKDYAFVYTYTGRTIPIRMGIIAGDRVKASWYKPTDGTARDIGEFENTGVREFDPPGEPVDGNDWVLVLDGIHEKKEK
jgi:hypothetical protein